MVVFFGGCHSKVANLEIAPQKINLDNLASDTISFDSLFYDVKFIPLENNRNAMLSHVSKLIVTKEQYIVFDTGIIPSVLLFDKEGGFKCQVGSMGHGRGEYQYIFDLSADDENNIVISTFVPERSRDVVLLALSSRSILPFSSNWYPLALRIVINSELLTATLL